MSEDVIRAFSVLDDQCQSASPFGHRVVSGAQAASAVAGRACEWGRPGRDPLLRELLRRLADEGITILLSSHLLSEVEQVCTRVAMISRGRIVHEGALDDLGALRPALSA